MKTTIILVITCIFSLGSYFLSTDKSSNEQRIKISCNNLENADNNACCSLEGPLDLPEAYKQTLQCSCEGCEMRVTSSENITNLDELMEEVSPDWVNETYWKKAIKQITKKSGADTYKITAIESVIQDESVVLEFHYTYAKETGKVSISINQ